MVLALTIPFLWRLKMICSNCNNEDRSAILFQGKWVCTICYNRKNRPELLLVRHWTNDSLFDINRKVYISMNLKTLSSCGFKILSHRIYHNKDASPVYKEYITLRFFGNLSCTLIPNYAWPKYQQYCRSLSCR